MKLYVEEYGSGTPTVLLLHGLSANGACWEKFIRSFRSRFDGRLVVVDFRGHGRSPHAAHYGYGQHAADIAELLSPEERVYVVGHSMGGVVGFALATGWFGVVVAGLLAFSTRGVFNANDLIKLAAYAQTPVRWFDSRSEAASRFLKVSGLDPFYGTDSAVACAGIKQVGDRYRLSADPRTVTVAGPELERLAAMAISPVVLACGSEDTIASLDELRRIDPTTVELLGVGHNPHVEQPEMLVELIYEKLFDA